MLASRRLAVTGFLLVAFALAAQKSVTDAVLRSPNARPGEWLTHGRDYAETRYSPLDRIHAGNIKELGLAWSFDTGTKRGLEATPLVVNGVMYLTGSWSVVFALDARTGRQRWKWDPEVPRSTGQKACCDVVNRGVAFHQGKVFVGTLDGRLVAIDARTGLPVWSIVTVDQSQPYTITGAPRIVKGKVIIGNGGAEYGVRGYVSAYDSGTGKLAWRFYTVPGDPSKPFESPAMEKAAKTWTGEWWKMGGGGTVWDSMAFDPDLDLLYIGTGNGSPWNQAIRSPGGGDNLYLSSILALRPDTGELVWHYQTTPGESWDYTATQHMVLADLEIAGQKRRVLMQAPKNGFFYVLDRATGELLAADPFVAINWASRVDLKTGRPIENPGARYTSDMALLLPGPVGAHNWHPMSFHPGTGLVYLPAQEPIFPYVPDAGFKYRPGQWNLGVELGVLTDPAPPLPGSLIAWDPVARKPRWRVPYPSLWNSGTLATAGNLVFQGTADGRFAAYSADKGERLWEAQVGTGIIASPITYTATVGGTQYVTVLAGYGGTYALTNPSASGAGPTPGRVLTFALQGKKAIPAVNKAAVPQLTPVEANATPEQMKAGAVLFARWCATCHGVAAVSGGVLPDLRMSRADVFPKYPAIVLDGALVDLGMPAFKPWLTREEVEAIRAWVVRRRGDLASGK